MGTLLPLAIIGLSLAIFVIVVRFFLVLPDHAAKIAYELERIANALEKRNRIEQK